ncbi:12254_t:CDS:2, partial [Funneliformis geosporum]
GKIRYVESENKYKDKDWKRRRDLEEDKEVLESEKKKWGDEFLECQESLKEKEILETSLQTPIKYITIT